MNRYSVATILVSVAQTLPIQTSHLIQSSIFGNIGKGNKSWNSFHLHVETSSATLSNDNRHTALGIPRHVSQAISRTLEAAIQTSVSRTMFNVVQRELEQEC